MRTHESNRNAADPTQGYPVFTIDLDLSITDVDRAMFAHPRWRDLELALILADHGEVHGASDEESRRVQRVADRIFYQLRRRACHTLARARSRKQTVSQLVTRCIARPRQRSRRTRATAKPSANSDGDAPGDGAGSRDFGQAPRRLNAPEADVFTDRVPVAVALIVDAFIALRRGGRR
jgi:hypothetical protein